MVPNVFVSFGKCIWLPCDTEGAPPPNIEWYRDGVRAFTNLPKYQVHVNGTLRICNAAESESGTYMCIARNRGGTTNATTVLDIQG